MYENFLKKVTVLIYLFYIKSVGSSLGKWTYIKNKFSMFVLSLVFLLQPWVDFFTNEVMIHPLSNRPEDKRSFIPSKWEKLKVK